MSPQIEGFPKLKAVLASLPTLPEKEWNYFPQYVKK
jgi:hypothetical protein